MLRIFPGASDNLRVKKGIGPARGRGGKFDGLPYANHGAGVSAGWNGE